MNLMIGTTPEGKPFTLPADLGDKKIALLAQSNKGKTYGLGDILEELVKARRPFIATDPANNLWGLRVLPDGRPSGLQVVVIGGDHADIPFEKDSGERLAEALLATPICAVIDLAFESAGWVRRFMTDFAARLMQTKPEIPRVIVLEEAPVLIPQNAFGIQAQMCKAAVSKLATIGGNFGYGVIPACQRPATMDKDVLSQCEALIVMGITHKKDRDSIREWMEAKDIGERAAAAFNELGSLKPGEAWCWWPGEDLFQRFTFRKRETLHPREMRKLGLKAANVELGDMQTFVEKVKRELTKTVVAVHVDKKAKPATLHAIGQMAEKASVRLEISKVPVEEFDRVQSENSGLKAKITTLENLLAEARRHSHDSERRLEVVRAHLRPQYDALSKLFQDLGAADPGQDLGAADPGPFKIWFEKAPRESHRKALEFLIRKGHGSRFQISTVAGIDPTSTFYKVKTWLIRNGLAEEDGDELKLRAV